MKLVRQEQVEEDKSRLQAKATDLYHTGKMGSLADINETLGNFLPSSVPSPNLILIPLQP